jgi:hypothetical protein
MLCINRRVSLQIVQSTSCPPRPGAQGAPIFWLPGLSVIYQADNAPRNTRTIVSLNSAGTDGCKTPAWNRLYGLPVKPLFEVFYS